MGELSNSLKTNETLPTPWQWEGAIQWEFPPSVVGVGMVTEEWVQEQVRPRSLQALLCALCSCDLTCSMGSGLCLSAGAYITVQVRARPLILMTPFYEIVQPKQTWR